MSRRGRPGGAAAAKRVTRRSARGAGERTPASFVGCGGGRSEGQRLWPCGGDGSGWLFRVDGELSATNKWGPDDRQQLVPFEI